MSRVWLQVVVFGFFYGVCSPVTGGGKRRHLVRRTLQTLNVVTAMNRDQIVP